VLVRTAEDLEKQVSLLKDDLWSGQLFYGHYILGLDSEWKPEKDKGDSSPTSVLQLSGPTITLVIQMQQINIEKLSESSLCVLLGDEKILKVGVGIRQDVGRLLRDFNLNTRGFLDLNDLCSKINHTRSSLMNLSIDCFGVDWGGMKGGDESSITMSDWSLEKLSQDQLYYAACDAFISRKCFYKLCENWRGTGQKLGAWVLQQKGLQADKLKCTRRLLAKTGGDRERSLKGMVAKQKRREKSIACRSRKGNLYEHCRLLNQEGQILANCNRKKIQWYLDRNLGTIVKQQPLTLRLNFVANGPGHRGDKFYLEKRENVCVGCGSSNNLHRYHVVPLYYRKHFPEFLRSHCSHDIVLLCIDCRAKVKELVMFERIAKETGVPLKIQKYVDYPKIAHAKKAAAVLLKPEVMSRIPPDRLQKLKDACANFLKKPFEKVTLEELQKIYNLKAREPLLSYIPPGKQIVDNMSLDEVRKLIYRWRQFFLDTVNPQHLSKHWSVYAER